MGYKISKAYLGKQLVRPAEITETYTYNSRDTNRTIRKQGYKIVRVQFDMEQTSSNSSYDTRFFLCVKENSSTSSALQTELRGGYYWGVATPQLYGGLRYGDSNTEICSFPSSATSKTKSAAQIIFDEHTWQVKVGQTHGNRLYTNSGTFNSSATSFIQAIFNSQTATGRGNFGATSNVTKSTIIVTYTPN